MERRGILAHCWYTKRPTALGIPRRSPIQSTNPAQCCLTSVIRQEPVHSAWYGRRPMQHLQRHLIYRQSDYSIWGFGRKQLKTLDSNWDLMQRLRLDEKKGDSRPLLVYKKTYSTGYSQAVTHPSTNPAQCCLTSVIRREPVHSAWYGRRTMHHLQRHLLYRHSDCSIWAYVGRHLKR